LTHPVNDFSMDHATFEAEFESLRLIVENSLRRTAEVNQSHAQVLKQAMEYSLFARAKRIRPILALQAGKLFGARQEKILDIVVAIEHLHTYSLIHDDLPCMDDTDYRRGIETCHKKFGEDIATLAGDALLTLAWDTIIVRSREQGFSDKVIVDLISILSRAIGADGMIAGQVLDLQAERRKSSLKEVSEIHEYKTGKLFVGSLQVGGVLAGASEMELKLLSDFGEHFGMVFQITDDILDLTGTTESLGKPQGSDLALEKSTVPSVLGIDKSRVLAKQHVTMGKDLLSPIGSPEARFLQNLMDYLLVRTS
jgi:geranylgeranyl diphosphate synthase, type II